jgi:hypothetical protein
MLDFPVRISQFASSFVIDLKRKNLFLRQGISGRTLRVSPQTLRFFQSLKKTGTVTPRYLAKHLDPASRPILELFLQEKILLPAYENELESLWKQYPYCREAISFLNENGQREYLNPEWTGDQYVIHSYFPDEISNGLLELAEGELSLQEIYKKLSQRFPKKSLKKELERAIFELCSEHLQLLLFSTNPQEKGKRPFSTPSFSFQHSQATKQRKEKDSSGGVVQLQNFHQTKIHDAFHEFDQVEITVSHAFREPNEALGGQSYGASFFDSCLTHGFFRENCRILEVGGGTGVFSLEFLAAAAKKQLSIEKYEILDLSPALQKSQKALHAKNPQVDFLAGNAESFALPQESYRCILANEVVADFTTVKLQKNQLTTKKSSNPEQKEAKEWIRNYSLPVADAPEEFYFNLGTARFLKNIYGALEKGGWGVLVEFGGVASYPEATTHLNHDEYSIHWGQMAFLAKQLGFSQVLMEDLVGFLPFHQQAKLLSSDIYCLQEVFRRFGKTLPLTAMDEKRWQKEKKKIAAANVQGIEFSFLIENSHWGPSPKGFQVLLVQK